MNAQRVLLVDDDPDYRLLLRLALSRGGEFEVVGEAADGTEAAEAARSTRPDLVLLDCSLPGTDPFEDLPRIRAAAPEARVVLVSGHSPDELRVASRAVGALGWLSKETPARRLADELAALGALVSAAQRALDQARTDLAGDRLSPRAARRFVGDTLRQWDLGGLTETVDVLVSELVTNAVVHAGSDIEVMVTLFPDVARVEVTDASDTEPVVRDAADDATSGRGMALVDAMASQWGVRARPGGGKTVWFEVARDS